MSKTSDIMNYRFLTTETNLKALYIFRCLFTTSSVKLFVVNVQIFVYHCVFRKKEKQHSLNLSHFKNESTFRKRTIIWKWKLIQKPILKMKTCFSKLLNSQSMFFEIIFGFWSKNLCLVQSKKFCHFINEIRFPNIYILYRLGIQKF